MVDVSVDMLVNANVTALDVTGIDWEFALSPPYAVDVLVCEWYETVGNIDVSIDVGVLAAAMTALELAISPSLEATLSFCCAALTCWPMADLNWDRVLQA